MKSILLIIPYIGKWPLWFDAHLISMASNPTVNWLFLSDANVPAEYPDNVQFIKTTVAELNESVNGSLQVDVKLSPRKICDIRPAFGRIFKEYIDGYDFWGFCDVDIVWGNIRKFMTNDLLEKYDIISALENMVCGHFTIFKNHEKNLYIYKNDPHYKSIFTNPAHLRYDEVGLTNILCKLQEEGLTKIFWDKNHLQNGIKSEIHQEYYLDRWLYKDGGIFDLFSNNEREYMYLHFINWKRTIKFCEVEYSDTPEQFYISYNGMHYKAHSSFAKRWNWVRNLFDGYYVLGRRIILKKKIMSLKKRVITRLGQIN